MTHISIDDFKKLEIRVGTIKHAERVPDTDKLLRLVVDMGEREMRQIISGIAEAFPNQDELIGMQCTFAANLEPRIIRGLESQGMILAVGDEPGGDAFALLVPFRPVPPGSRAH
ncbi:MAG TPA: methionine--tRNA ligase [Candidatus Paceibacterota bacterium]|jgi:methionine--tRNA ligase beta chain